MKRNQGQSGLTTPAYLLHEQDAPRSAALWAVMALVLGLTLVPGVVFLFFTVGGAVVMFGMTALDALMIYFVIPRRYQVYNTKLRIVLGWPLAWDIPLSTIMEARPADGFDSWAYAGVRFATYSKTPVEILRRRGLNVIITPCDREDFLSRLNEALSVARDPQV